MYDFTVCEKSSIPWDQIESSLDSNIFHTKDWMKFLFACKGLNPFIVRIHREDKTIGFFIGYKFKKIGFNIIGSPFEGWTTSYQGICSEYPLGPEQRIAIYKDLSKYCNKHCILLQFSDWNINNDDVKGHFKNFNLQNSYYLDLSPDIETLFKSFKQKSCQYAIHKAQKLGVKIQEPEQLDEFAEEYYNELIDVFSKQGLSPTYSVDRVKHLLNNVAPYHRTLLEARHPETNECIATIIFVHHNHMAFYWGAASYRSYQKYCPNELLMFEAIKRMKEVGVTLLEMEGIRPYKEKYNPVQYSKPQVMIGKFPFVVPLKNFAKRTFFQLRNFKNMYG